MENIVIGSDHAGIDLKETIKEFLKQINYDVEDMGTFTKDSCDYPLIAQKVVNKSTKENKKAILICGTGIGMCMAANKIKGARAVVCTETTSAKFSRLHNNSNVLCLGARILGENLAKDICEIWLNTGFENGRHQKRIDMFDLC